MKVKVIKKTANELKIEIEGAGHGLCGLLQKTLLEGEEVERAGYDIVHPLVPTPVVYVRTEKGSKPEIVLMKAARRARKTSNDFKKELDKALKS